MNDKTEEIRHLKSEIQELETKIEDKKQDIRSYRKNIKNLPWNRRWLAPLIRGTVETMEETVKLLENDKSFKQEMLNNLSYNNNEKN